MARPEDRMRLKDRIIDNISKAIKSIQELIYYHSKDPVTSNADARCEENTFIVLHNSDRPCHKLSENLDHALLHGLKNVTHGYWRIVKQLSHKGMVREIENLTNVTTDLGRGRAWLCACLNECLLECYIRMLSNNEKLLKKHYAKDAFLLDSDRMNLLLTLTSGLDFVTFKLDYDLPYLDLSAYPPHSRTTASLDGDALPSERSKSSVEVRTSTPDSTAPLASDSDSASVGSFDVQSQAEHPRMRISVMSVDSGCPTYENSSFGLGSKQRSITPTESFSTKHRGSDSVSISSIGSSADPDKHQRLESIVSLIDQDEDGDSCSFEVIRVKGKRGSGAKGKKKKTSSLARNAGNNIGLSEFTEGRRDSSSSLEKVLENDNLDGKSKHGEETRGGVVNSMDMNRSCDGAVQRNSVVPHGECEKYEVDETDKSTTISLPQFDSGVDICGLTTSTSQMEESQTHSSAAAEVATVAEPQVQCDERSKITGPLLTEAEPRSALAEIQSKIDLLCSVDDQGSNHSEKSQSNNYAILSSEFSSSIYDSYGKQGETVQGGGDANSEKTSVSKHSIYREQHTQASNSSVYASDVKTVGVGGKSLPALESASSGMDHTQHPSTQSGVPQRISPKDGRRQEDSLNDSEDDFDFYSSHRSVSGDSETEASVASKHSQMSEGQAATHLQDYMDFILTSSENPDSEHETPNVEKEPELAIILDNNTKLHLMLDIFLYEEENFIKMFVTRENHTEGDVQPLFMLVSDQCLYTLKYRHATRKFVVQSSAMLKDLIFISTGLFDQTMNIESRNSNGQKQRLWLTTGHQALTQAILTCLTDAVKEAVKSSASPRSRFSVGSEVPLQKIAIRKYVSREIPCEAQDVVVVDYSLVFWEDPSSSSKNSAATAYREGTLLLRTQDPFKGHVWKPVYVVIKNSMLCISNHKSDLRPHSYLGLGGDQCVGCRLTAVSDRENCLELVLAKGGSWFLSAASQSEISEWRQILCVAVSQGMQNDDMLSACVPCCVILACNKLFMCHEDPQTKFFRTLGHAQLEEVTSVLVDEVDPTYCVVQFESQETGVTSVQWVFYFNSALDLDRHKVAVSDAWKEIYQVDLPILPLDDITLQRLCQSHAAQIRKGLDFS